LFSYHRSLLANENRVVQVQKETGSVLCCCCWAILYTRICERNQKMRQTVFFFLAYLKVDVGAEEILAV